MPERGTFFIGGDWTAARGTAIITVVNPSTGEIVGRVPEGTTADIDAAAAAARAPGGQPTRSVGGPLPGGCAPARSVSTATCRILPRRSAVARRAATAATSAPRRSPRTQIKSIDV